MASLPGSSHPGQQPQARGLTWKPWFAWRPVRVRRRNWKGRLWYGGSEVLPFTYHWAWLRLVACRLDSKIVRRGWGAAISQQWQYAEVFEAALGWHDGPDRHA